MGWLTYCRSGLGWANLNLACLCFCSQLEDQLVAGCSRMASAGTTLFTSKFFSLPFRRLMGLVLTMVAFIQEGKQKCTVPHEAKARKWDSFPDVTFSCPKHATRLAYSQRLGNRLQVFRNREESRLKQDRRTERWKLEHFCNKITMQHKYLGGNRS